MFMEFYILQLNCLEAKMSNYTFVHTRLPNIVFNIQAQKFYDAIAELELILGPEKLWIGDFYVLKDGIHVGLQYAA